MTPEIDWRALNRQLAEPFAATEVSWRAGAVARDRKRAQALPYVDPRAYEERLDTLCPGAWRVAFDPWGDTRLICRLTLHTVERASTGEIDADDHISKGPSAEAQAFKRACSKFGLGRYLYSIPIQWVEYDDEKKRLVETPDLRRAHLPAGPVPDAVAADILDPTEPAPIGARNASEMHRNLARLGFNEPGRRRLAADVLGREVESFTTLTRREAAAVWEAAREQTGESTS